jgi:predicted glycosyltransferase
MSQGSVTIRPQPIEPPPLPMAEIATLAPAVPVPTFTPISTGKKVWIDIDNSPHVPFFLPIIHELEQRGVEVTLTARDIYQVCQLLEFFKLKCKVVGGHYGKNKLFKVLGNCVRAAQLLPIAARNRPSVALSHGSRAQVLACKALGIPTIMMHDYEHSTKTGFVEPDWTFMPDIIPDGAMAKASARTLKYPGLKEDVYVPRFRPDRSILDTLGIANAGLIITLRPPATEAHYHNPEAEQLFAETLRLLAETPEARAVALPRNAKQGAELRKQWPELIRSGKLIIPERPVEGLNLIWFSDLVVSGGGTMNREAAALGVPVYSVFRGKIGAVDRYLADAGRLIMLESVNDVRTKMKLVRWNRPANPENTNRPALMSIVDNITAILEGKCPTKPCLA